MALATHVKDKKKKHILPHDFAVPFQNWKKHIFENGTKDEQGKKFPNGHSKSDSERFLWI